MPTWLCPSGMTMVMSDLGFELESILRVLPLHAVVLSDECQIGCFGLLADKKKLKRI